MCKEVFSPKITNKFVKDIKLLLLFFQIPSLWNSESFTCTCTGADCIHCQLFSSYCLLPTVALFCACVKEKTH